MRNRSARSILIPALAIGGAVIWGAMEFIALQWSRLSERWWSLGRSRAF